MHCRVDLNFHNEFGFSPDTPNERHFSLIHCIIRISLSQHPLAHTLHFTQLFIISEEKGGWSGYELVDGQSEDVRYNFRCEHEFSSHLIDQAPTPIRTLQSRHYQPPSHSSWWKESGYLAVISCHTAFKMFAKDLSMPYRMRVGHCIEAMWGSAIIACCWCNGRCVAESAHVIQVDVSRLMAFMQIDGDEFIWSDHHHLRSRKDHHDGAQKPVDPETM